MRILFLPNWKVHQLQADTIAYQAPDKQVALQPYWFFKYFPANCQVDIIDFQQNNALTPLEKKLNLYIWQALKAFFKRKQYDIVISHGAQSGMVYALLNTITFSKKPLHIIIDIGGMNGGRQRLLENSLITFALKSKPAIICHSRVIIQNYLHTYKQLIKNTRFITFGIDADDFKPQKLIESGSYILSFGAAKRDYATLLQAWAGVESNYKLRIIGLPKNNPLTKGVKNVEVIEKVSIAELKTHIANAKFVVIALPVFNYSYGQMSFLQSMSMGKAVIVTCTPSSIDYLQDGQGALLTKPYDSDDMREKISYLLNNSAALKALSDQARPYVLTHFSEQTMAENMHQFMQQQLALNGP